MKMNYDEARQYIKEASKAGIRPGLSCMRELCRRLENPQDDLKHFGMGMYISRIYCERHGGKLLIKNAADGGAEVEAVFKNYVSEEQQQK